MMLRLALLGALVAVAVAPGPSSKCKFVPGQDWNSAGVQATSVTTQEACCEACINCERQPWRSIFSE